MSRGEPGTLSLEKAIDAYNDRLEALGFESGDGSVIGEVGGDRMRLLMVGLDIDVPELRAMARMVRDQEGDLFLAGPDDRTPISSALTQGFILGVIAARRGVVAP